MRIELFEGLAIELNLSKEYEYGVDFEGSIWCCEDGEVMYRGIFNTVDQDGNVIPLPDFEPDGDRLLEEIGIDKYEIIREHSTELGYKRHDLEH